MQARRCKLGGAPSTDWRASDVLDTIVGMGIKASPCAVRDILPFRELHRADMQCQIVHDSLHERGFTRPYLLEVGGEAVGYGTVVGFAEEPKDTVDEFFVLRERRGEALPLFRTFLRASGAKKIQAQTNDRLLLLMLLDFGERIERDRILFEDGFLTRLDSRGASFRRAGAEDAARPFGGRRVSEVGEWVLEAEGEIVAVGGVLFHYNPPYGDIHMETAEAYRRRGYGSYLVQELKRVCYEMDKVPAARCRADHLASRATLQRAGMLPCASLVTAGIRATELDG